MALSWLTGFQCYLVTCLLQALDLIRLSEVRLSFVPKKQLSILVGSFNDISR
jgi:hypothetical protein